MTDALLAQLERTAIVEGRDPLRDVPLFMAKVRAEWWEPWTWTCETNCLVGSRQDRYELAAYLGHAGARELVGTRTGNAVLDTVSVTPFSGWLRGLQRWRPDRMFWVKGACAAGRVALAIHEAKGGAHSMECLSSELPCFCAVSNHLRALEAAEAWLACPCQEHEPELARWGDPGNSSPIPQEDEWWRQLRNAIGVPGQYSWRSRRAIISAAEIAGEQPVRAALQDTWLRRVLS